MKTKQIIILITVIVILVMIPTIIVITKNNSINNKTLETSNENANSEKKNDKDEDNSNAEEEKTINVLNEDVNVKYTNSEDDLDIYEDENGEDYYLKNGKVVGFSKVKKQKQGDKKISEKEAKEIAYEYAKNNVYEFDKYTFIEIYFIDDYDNYSINFNKKIGGYLTADLINIKIDEYGNITTFLAPRQGELDRYQGIKIDEKDIDKKIDEYVNTEYKTHLEKNELELKSYEVTERALCIKDGKLVMLNGISTRIIGKGSEVELHDGIEYEYVFE